MRDTYGRTVLATIAACLLCGCDGMTRISGFVVDPDGTGIANAILKVQATPKFQKRLGPPRNETSNAIGAYDFEFSHAPIKGEFDLTVTHPDYSEVQEVVTTGSHKNHDIRMKRRDPPKSPKDD